MRGLAHPLAPVRAACARALAGSQEARAALRGALADPDAEVRLAAVEALRDPPRAPISRRCWPTRMRACAPRRRRARRRRAEHLVRMLESDDRESRLAALAVAGAALRGWIARDRRRSGSGAARGGARAARRGRARSRARRRDRARARRRGPARALRRAARGRAASDSRRPRARRRGAARPGRGCATAPPKRSRPRATPASRPRCLTCATRARRSRARRCGGRAAATHPRRGSFLVRRAAPARRARLAGARRAPPVPGRRRAGRALPARSRPPTHCCVSAGSRSARSSAREPARRAPCRARAALRQRPRARRRARGALEPRRPRRRAAARADARAGPIEERVAALGSAVALPRAATHSSPRRGDRTTAGCRWRWQRATALGETPGTEQRSWNDSSPSSAYRSSRT